MRTAELQAQALTRATTSQALTNYPTIFEGFIEKGIPDDQIKPRENVFTFHAWKALGRQVRKGEHGVRICVWIPIMGTNPDTGEPMQTGRKAHATTVFHVSQTERIVS